jgi:hypothetical protein
MIIINNQQEMIDVGLAFLHQETNLTQQDVAIMPEFDIYYQARELIKQWNQLPPLYHNNKILSLEIMGINFKQINI